MNTRCSVLSNLGDKLAFGEDKRTCDSPKHSYLRRSSGVHRILEARRKVGTHGNSQDSSIMSWATVIRDCLHSRYSVESKLVGKSWYSECLHHGRTRTWRRRYHRWGVRPACCQEWVEWTSPFSIWKGLWARPRPKCLKAQGSVNIRSLNAMLYDENGPRTQQPQSYLLTFDR